MRFSNIVVAALNAPIFVDGTPQERDEAVEETMHFGDENPLIMTSVPDQPLPALPCSWVDEGSLAPIDLDASNGKASLAQGLELRNPEDEIEHASGDENDGFTVDIGVLSMERKLSTECAVNPVVNETGWMSPFDFLLLVYFCYSDSPHLEDCPEEYNVGLHCWDTSFMTDLSTAFSLHHFNDDISSWNTGKVTALSQTFYKAYSFNQDISSWDTGNVTTLSQSFYKAFSFNSDISTWDTGKVTTLHRTFYSAWEFNSDISTWDTGKVTALDGAFENAIHFNSNISSWNTGNVTTLRQTFERAYDFNSDISSWDIGKVTTLKRTFARTPSFNQDISSWNTGKVTSLHRTFARSGSFNSDISSWDTGKVKNMRRTFQNAVAFNQCIGSWAANSPSTVDTYWMLYGTACSNPSDPDPEKGPWCQGFEDRCFGACVDAEDFRFGKNETSCSDIHELLNNDNIKKICNKPAFPGEEATGMIIRVQNVCQETCGTHGFGPGKRCDKFTI